MSDKNTVRNKKADDIFKRQKIQPLNSKTVFLPTSYNNNVFDVEESEEEQNQYNHPYYSDKSNYPDKQYIQKQKTALSTPNHNPFPFMIENNQIDLSNSVPSSLQSFIDQLFSSISELFNELMSTNKNTTIEEIKNKFTKNNRLFYIGVVLLLLFVARYLLSGIFG